MKKLLPALLLLFLTACGAVPEEKIAEAQTALAALQDARAHADEIYDTLWDDALFVRLTEAGKQADALAEAEIAALSGAQIDEAFLPAVRELTETYAELQELLDRTAEAEEAERSEREGRKQLTFHVLNRSGEAYAALIWEQGAQKPEELLSLREPLANGETLAGVTVMVSEEAQPLWFRGVPPGETAPGAPAEADAAGDGRGEIAESAGRRYEIGKTDDFPADALFYLVLLPDGQAEITSAPADLPAAE